MCQKRFLTISQKHFSTLVSAFLGIFLTYHLSPTQNWFDDDNQKQQRIAFFPNVKVLQPANT